MAQIESGNSRIAYPSSNYKLQNALLLLVAGFGGLLYGVDVGIIGGALPYLEATSGLSAGQLSVIVAAVLLGSVFSTLFAGLLADWMGRKPLMIAERHHVCDQHSGHRAFAWIWAVILRAPAAGYQRRTYRRGGSAVSGRVPGRAGARQRHGVFQWLLTLGIVVAALIGIYYSYRVEAIERVANRLRLFACQRPGLAEHLLGVAAAGPAFCSRQHSSFPSRRAGSSAAARWSAHAPRCCARAPRKKPRSR